jgi:hypothetical protein
MKKQILYLASAALVAGLAACSNDELGESSRLNLKKGELSATIQDAVSTRTNIDGQYKLTWADEDAIGVYGTLSDNSQNYKYEITKAGEPEAITGVFAAAEDQDIADDFVPAVAYYPYGKGHNEKITSQGKLALNLDDEITYTAGEVKAPLVGDVVNGNISFKAVTALLKIRVENVPYDATNTLTKAVLTTEGKKAIAGKAYVDLTKDADKRVLEVSDDSKKQSITITFENKAVGSYDFYYIIPEGDYDLLTVTLQKADDTEGTYTKTLISEKSLEAKANHIYTKTLRFDGDDLEDGVIAQLNDDLVTVANNGSVTADLSKATAESGKIILPSVDPKSTTEKPLDQITINLQNLGTQALTLQPSITDGLTPKKVIVKVSNQPESKTSNSNSLTIALPNSSVELAPVDDKVTLDAVTFSTQPNVLKLDKGVTVTALTKTASTGTGHVYVAEGASLVTLTANNIDTYLFYEDKANINSISDGSNITTAEKAIYELLYPVANGKPALTDGFQLKTPIEIDVPNVQLNLGGKTLTALTNSKAIIVKEGGSLTIVDNPATDVKTTGTIDGNGTGVAIEVQKGGSVTVSAGAIKNDSGNGVTVTGGTFTLNGGTISASTSGKHAISLSNGATATINSASVINAASANYAVAGDIKAEKSSDDNATASTLNLNKGTVSGVLTLTASNLNVNGGTLAGTSASAATVTATEGAAITVENGEISASTKEAVSLNASTLTVNDGTIKQDNSTATSAIVDETTKATIAINGGTITSKAGIALDIQNDSEVTVKGGTINGKKSAVDVKKGTLTVEGDGAPAFTGDNVIASTPTNDREAVITLKAAKATYVAEDYVIYNSATPAAKKVSLTVEGGYFTGDIKTDDTNYFIGGGFFKNCDTLEKDDASKYFVSGYKLSTSTNNEGFYEVVKK